MIDAPPQNVETERALLATMMESARARRVAIDLLRRDDFIRPAHRVVWDAIVWLHQHGKTVDAITVIDELAAKPAPKGSGVDRCIELVGGKSGVMDIDGQFHVTSSSRAYAEEIRRCGLLRQVDSVGKEASVAAREKQLPAEAIAIAERGVLQLRERLNNSTSGGLQSENDAVDDFCDRYAEGPDTDLVRFSLPTLSREYGGRRKGQVGFVGGWSSDGKSWYLLGELEAAARDGHRCLLVTAEVPTEEIVARQVAMGGHDFGKVMQRSLPVATLAPRVRELRQLPIDIEERSRPTMGYLRTLLLRAMADGNPYRYVVVDHFHLMDHQAGKTGGDYRIAIGESAGAAKEMAKDFGCSIDFAVQLRRANAAGARKFPLPGMQDIRESSAVENIADFVFMVWRERSDPPQETQLATGLVSVAKVRSGRPIAPIPVAFLSTKFQFKEQVITIRGAVA